MRNPDNPDRRRQRTAPRPGVGGRPRNYSPETPLARVGIIISQAEADEALEIGGGWSLAKIGRAAFLLWLEMQRQRTQAINKDV